MLVADYLCFCLFDIQLCSAELAQLVLAGLLTLFNYLSSAGVIWFIKFMYFLWRRFYVLIIIILVFLDEGFVMIWVELPSSAPILWFDVLSLVNWIAGLPSVSNVLSEYFSFFGLNPFLTYCCSGKLQFASWTVRVLCFNLSEGVASELATRCLLLYCLSTFDLSGEMLQGWLPDVSCCIV